MNRHIYYNISRSRENIYSWTQLLFRVEGRIRRTVQIRSRFLAKPNSMHRSKIYSPRNGAILCHYLSARRAVNCPATNVASYFKFAAFLLLLLAIVSLCLQERKGSIALSCPPAGWCGWALKGGWKNGKCLTNGAVNEAVDKLI